MTPKTISVFIDSCAWNYFFERQTDLSIVFPRDRFQLSQTNEVNIEINAIPETGKDGSDKRPLKNYIAKSMDANELATQVIFGFASSDADGQLSRIQRFGGFDQGSFISDEAMATSSEPGLLEFIQGKGERSSGLISNEADMSLVVHSSSALIVTAESPKKRGPLKWGKEEYNRAILFLSEAEESGAALEDYVKQFVEKSFPKQNEE